MNDKFVKWNRIFWISVVLLAPMVIIGAEVCKRYLIEYGLMVDYIISCLIPGGLVYFCYWKRRLAKTSV